MKLISNLKISNNMYIVIQDIRHNLINKNINHEFHFKITVSKPQTPRPTLCRENPLLFRGKTLF